ncbi:MAG: hydrogen gas-evolving membrane-bound hydrogenase subunit E [bacterium]
MSHLLGAVPFIAVLAAPLAGALANRLRLHPGWVSALVPAGLLIALAQLLPGVFGGEAVRLSLPWFPDLGIRYALTLDGLALLFSLLIVAVGLLILIYSVAYMHASPELGRFYAHMLVFMGAMLGVVLADDLVLLYVFWELTSLASFFLIGYRNEDPAARAGATQALIVTVAGGVAMLAGFVMLAQAGGSWQISVLLAKAGAIKADPRYPAILWLVLLGAFTKSAQVPFQFWLPSAMVAPTPVSTYLHSATMVWAGVYLLARLLPVLGGTGAWTSVVTSVGLVTLLAGAGLALVQTDLKALLAYSTVGALGLATALIGWGTPVAVAAAMVHVLNHAAFKGTLFLIAGAVEHETGTRAIDRLAGLGRVMPVTMGIAAIAALSMAGLPPFGGFLSKEAAVDAFLKGSSLAAGVVILSGALSLAYGVRFLSIFLGPGFSMGARSPMGTVSSKGPRQRHAPQRPVPPADVHEPPYLLWGPAAVLALGTLVFGLVLVPVERLAALATAAITGAPHPVALWHGMSFTVATVTGMAIAGGAVLFRLQAPAQRLATGASWASVGRLYDRLYAWTLDGAKSLTHFYLTGRLRDYLMYIMVTAMALVVFGLARTGVTARISPADLEAGPVIAVVVALSASIAAVRSRLLLGAVLALGAAGYSVSLIYLLLSAPDIAITQAVIETVSLVLFLVAIAALAKSDPGYPQPRPMTDGPMALVAGGVSAVLAAMVANLSNLPRIADAFFTHAAEAGGKNVVNLVIVDFRGWDTMGEISVLVIAALGIIALAPWRTPAAALNSGHAGPVGPTMPRSRSHRREIHEEAPMTSLILRTIARIVSPVIVMYALLLWATGHYGPGGGFVAGLMVAGSIVLRAQAYGTDRLVRRWDVVMAIGLLLAAGSAAVPLAFGQPLLQHTLLAVGSLGLPSSLIFDMGVLWVVTGSVMSAVRSLVEAA